MIVSYKPVKEGHFMVVVDGKRAGTIRNGEFIATGKVDAVSLPLIQLFAGKQKRKARKIARRDRQWLNFAEDLFALTDTRA
jgi:hypothetical protein